jgi:hypothetical protein
MKATHSRKVSRNEAVKDMKTIEETTQDHRILKIAQDSKNDKAMMKVQKLDKEKVKGITFQESSCINVARFRNQVSNDGTLLRVDTDENTMQMVNLKDVAKPMSKPVRYDHISKSDESNY